MVSTRLHPSSDGLLIAMVSTRLHPSSDGLQKTQLNTKRTAFQLWGHSGNGKAIWLVAPASLRARTRPDTRRAQWKRFQPPTGVERTSDSFESVEYRARMGENHQTLPTFPTCPNYNRRTVFQSFTIKGTHGNLRCSHHQQTLSAKGAVAKPFVLPFLCQVYFFFSVVSILKG